MKKLMTLMLGMSLLFGTASVVFSQETPKKDDSKDKAPPDANSKPQ